MSETQPVPLLYGLRDASRLLAMSVATLRRQIQAGEIATIRIGGKGKIRIERAEIDRVIARNRQSAAAP